MKLELQSTNFQFQLSPPPTPLQGLSLLARVHSRATLGPRELSLSLRQLGWIVFVLIYCGIHIFAMEAS